MGIHVSVIICTHNPRTDYLDRVLNALRDQTLRDDKWELLLVDNASQPPLEARFDLRWHPNSRHIREEELGLTPARLRGTSESCGSLLVFVDDDNVLAPDYLANALDISISKPHIGAFGSSIVAEFEQQPSPEVRKYVSYLAVEEVTQDVWSNLLQFSKAVPLGAGLCVRRIVAHEYSRRANVGTKERLLGRVGDNLGGHEDTDLAFVAIDIGMGMGRFHRLQLTHLIPSWRLTEEYIIRIAAGGARTMTILMFLRNMTIPKPVPKWLDLARFVLYFIRASKFDRRIFVATHRAQRRVRLELGIP